MDIWRAVQSNSGRALRIARKRSESKVIQRRSNYDSALQRAHAMALTIGGLREYDAFEGITPESFEAGDLTHYIGKRKVYDNDPLDDLEVEREFWEVATVAVPLVGLEFYLTKHNWEPKDIKDAVAAYDEIIARQKRQEEGENEPTPLTE